MSGHHLRYIAIRTSYSKADHGADRLAGVHQFERLVDAFQRQFVGDERIEVDLAAHRLLDQARQLRAALDAAEGRTAPHASGHQLEWPGADFLSRAGDTDDHRLAPALVAALQRRTHHIDVADAFEAEVDAAIGEFDDHVLDRFVVILRVDAVGRAHAAREFELARIGIDREDAPRLRLHRALDHRKANTAETEHGDAVARLHFRGVVHGANPGGDTATEQAHFFQRRAGIDHR